jgi:hypothetical protein
MDDSFYTGRRPYDEFRREQNVISTLKRKTSANFLTFIAM